MTTTVEHAAFHQVTAVHPEEQELMAPEKLVMNPQSAARLRRMASHWLAQAQKEFHDAIFARDGSEEGRDRYASARAELDSAEAWALRVASAVSRLRD
jgi:hypothetical protein